MSQPVIIAMKGLPGSGKSTLVRDLKDQLFSQELLVDVISKDELRQDFPTASEKEIHRLQGDWLLQFVANGADVIIVDNTHMDPRSIKQLEGFAKHHNYEFRVEDVPTPWFECIERDNARRARGERYVGRSVIVQMAQRYGVYHKAKQKALVCDLDGTLCDIEHRRHYVAGPGKKDWKGFGREIPQDTPNEKVAEVIRLLKEQYTTLYVSGRSAEYRRETELWLEKHGLDFHFALYMRPINNFGDDTEIKRDIHDRFLLPHYDIQMVFDDRDRVVALWRELGYTCFQVAPGSF